MKNRSKGRFSRWNGVHFVTSSVVSLETIMGHAIRVQQDYERHEITWFSENDLLSAHEWDTRARALERQYKSLWLELAEVCIAIRDNEGWKLLGFHSYNAWLQDACPASRSMVYLAVGIREELKDLPREELKQICLSNAEILRKLPKAARTSPETLASAKALPPREFVSRAIQTSPDAHLEAFVTPHIRFSASAWKVIQTGIEMIQLLMGEEMSPGDCIEGAMVDWMLGHEQELENALGDSQAQGMGIVGEGQR